MTSESETLRAKLRRWNIARLALLNAPTVIDQKPGTLKLWNDLAEAEDELRREAVK